MKKSFQLLILLMLGTVTSKAQWLSTTLNVNETTLANGLTWYSPTPEDYAIFRTAGVWGAPDYQQLKLQFWTGIVLNPGSSYGKSYVDVQGGGLRVSSGNVGIGTLTPSAKLQIADGDVLLQNSTSGYPSLWLKNVGGTNTLKFDYNSMIHAGGDFYIRSGGTSNLFLNDPGNGGSVGIGTTAPGGKLDVNAGSAYAIRTSTSSRYVIEVKNASDTGGGWWLVNDPNGSFALHENTVGDQFTVKAGGNVGIGTANPDAKLAVKGQIHAQEVKVDLNGSVAPDYVFEKDYQLPSLQSIQSYINQNKHLPEVPSAKEMEANGVNLGEMNMLLLKKIEELTLYVIEQQTQIDELKRLTNEK